MSIYWRCIRPGLLLTALFSMTVAALTADRPPPWPRLAHTLLGTALLMAGATPAAAENAEETDASCWSALVTGAP